MTFLFAPPQPADFVGGTWGSLEIAPNATYQTIVDLRRFQGISDDNTTHIGITSTQAIDTGGTGVNGLDTGVLVVNRTYFIWAIADSTGVNPDAGIISLSDSAPSPMPGSYDKKRLLGSITTDGSPAFRPIRKVNDLVFHIEPFVLLNGAGPFAWAAISIATYSSIYARKALLRTTMVTSVDSQADYEARSQFKASTQAQYHHHAGGQNSGAGNVTTQSSYSGWVDLERVASAVNFDHRFSAGSGTISLIFVGFQEILPQ